ncbi:MAG: hypothetical protein DBY04_01175 [Clostridiales bacterium]|nr:MAG: hypothetical protein DBY04_01175 [Clostridiales bacterium]
MRRALCIIIFMLFIMVFAIGCDNTSNVEQDVESNLKNNTVTSTISELDNLQTRNSAELQYVCFENLLGKTTDLIEGEFVSQTNINGLYYYEFNVIKNLRGNNTENTIIIQSIPADYSVINTDINFSTYDVKYKQGSSYLLLLSRHSSVYTEGDVFSFVNDSLFIPLSNSINHAVKQQEASLYGMKLTDHLSSLQAVSSLNNGEFKEFILGKIQTNPLRYESEYIDSLNINSVIERSEYVLKIKVDDLYMGSYTGDRLTYNCTVEEILKGVLNKQNIKITFPTNTVEIGNFYIVALSELEGTSQNFFIISSKNSIYDCSNIESIRIIINNND